MISYSTNWMGPISIDWFRERGLTETVTKTVYSERQRDILRKSNPDIEIGDTFEHEIVAIHYSGGRIDIRDDTKEGYDGWNEYSLPLMRTEDWNDFSVWLDDFETEELWSLEDILEEYRQDTGHVIRWWKEDEWLKVIEEWKNAEESEVPCKTHPDAPHGFNRNASHSMGRYVCNCEFWEEDE